MTTKNTHLGDTIGVKISPEQQKKIESIQPIVNGSLPPVAPLLNSLGSPCCSPPRDPAKTSCHETSTPADCAPSANAASDGPCCGPRVMPTQKFIHVGIKNANGITYVKHQLRVADRWGTLKARLGNSRMAYAIEPGLYALGAPTQQSDVLVTANYKLTFDHLRSKLSNQNYWILVLDTWGINVWCAAGKGTFGTDELINRIKKTNLNRHVSTRKLIVPQLGAPGVAAHTVKEKTGFKVMWGPINAEDIHRFVENKYKADSIMRQKRFPLKERVVLIPIELRPALKIIFVILAVASPLAALAAPGNYIKGVVEYGILLALYLFSGLISGAVLTPLLLPYLPGRAFSLKSIWTSLGILIPLTLVLKSQIYILELVALALISVSLAAFAAMNFTGSSTYTSISGVKKEMRIAVPTEIGAASVGIVLWIAAQLVA